MDKLLALRAFVDVAETGGFSKAARRMGVATSSVTRLLDALEESLGSALLTRTTRQVTLTDAGVAYLEHVARILDELEEADGSVTDAGGEPTGPLRVSLPVTFGRLLLGPHIASFMTSYPRVSLDLLMTDTYVDFVADRIDIAVRIGQPANQPQLIVKPLTEHHRFVVASHEYLSSHGVPSVPADLSRHECLRFSYQKGRQHWSFTDKRGTARVAVNGRLAVNSSDMLREATLSGFGVALLPEWLVDEDVRTGRLRRIFEAYSVNPSEHVTSIYAAYLPNRRHSRKVQVFIEFLRQHLSRPALA
ncbi:LysR family transcriptional regulator [Dyella choica]|uniref:LysR family transcriptional regulator n=1 Tax=Dyella choica TaxID=1927959 RepID=A0A3S0R5Y5_9GAMM|nr:LysR family transcriptional regulator [Dyella choica]RUL78990.1 LysR family transcriptional regulator [Dyella choica]